MRSSAKQNTSAPLISLYVSISLASLLAQSGSANLLKSSLAGGSNGHQSPVQSWCQHGLNFTSLKEFRHFIEQFKSKSADEWRQEKVASGCVKHRDAILELESLVQTKDVCDPNLIDALVEYHERHFVGDGMFSSTKFSKPLMYKFFAKYAIQVAYICKKNLIINLEASREELQARSKVFEEAREKIFNDEPSIKSNIKLIEEQSDEPMSTNVKPKDGAEITLNEYRDALTKLKRPEDILTFDRRQCEQSASRRLSIAKEKVQTFFKPAMMCLQLARYYGGTILSIAKLANVGYVAVDEDLDVNLADSPMVKNWIIAAQVCEPMLYMSSEKIEGDVAIIDTCSQRVISIEAMGFEGDNLEELDNEMLEEMLPRSQATRNNAQKIMRSAMKKMAKVNLMRELKAGNLKKRSIFSKSLSVLAPANGALSTIQMDMSTNSQVSRQLLKGSIDTSSLDELATGQTPDEKSFEELMKVINENSGVSRTKQDGETDDKEGAVSMFDPVSSIASTLTVLAVMLTFEWLFFIVMTLAARLCHQLHFNFDNLLSFPPKVLSWSDADFTRFNDRLEKLDEDDFFDYDELNPDEQRQRDALAKVFGKPPPMLFRG